MSSTGIITSFELHESWSRLKSCYRHSFSYRHVVCDVFWGFEHLFSARKCPATPAVPPPGNFLQEIFSYFSGIFCILECLVRFIIVQKFPKAFLSVVQGFIFTYMGGVASHLSEIYLCRKFYMWFPCRKFLFLYFAARTRIPFSEPAYSIKLLGAYFWAEIQTALLSY